MSSEFDAIYERGIFRPLGPVDLPEHTKVHLQMERSEASIAVSAPPADVAAQQTAVLNLLRWLNDQPVSAHDDDAPAKEPFSARDHDLILYGWQK